MNTEHTPGLYSYSLDEENYQGYFDSRGAAITEAFAAYPDLNTVWTGLCITPPRIVDADNVIDMVAENTTSESGERADDYLCDVPKDAKAELQEELQAVWDKWEKKHDLAPTWFNVDEVEKHERATGKEAS